MSDRSGPSRRQGSDENNEDDVDDVSSGLSASASTSRPASPQPSDDHQPPQVANVSQASSATVRPPRDFSPESSAAAASTSSRPQSWMSSLRSTAATAASVLLPRAASSSPRRNPSHESLPSSDTEGSVPPVSSLVLVPEPLAESSEGDDSTGTATSLSSGARTASSSPQPDQTPRLQIRNLDPDPRAVATPSEGTGSGRVAGDLEAETDASIARARAAGTMNVEEQSVMDMLEAMSTSSGQTRSSQESRRPEPLSSPPTSPPSGPSGPGSVRFQLQPLETARLPSTRRSDPSFQTASTTRPAASLSSPSPVSAGAASDRSSYVSTHSDEGDLRPSRSVSGRSEVLSAVGSQRSRSMSPIKMPPPGQSDITSPQSAGSSTWAPPSTRSSASEASGTNTGPASSLWSRVMPHGSATGSPGSRNPTSVGPVEGLPGISEGVPEGYFVRRGSRSTRPSRHGTFDPSSESTTSEPERGYRGRRDYTEATSIVPSVGPASKVVEEQQVSEEETASEGGAEQATQDVGSEVASGSASGSALLSPSARSETSSFRTPLRRTAELEPAPGDSSIEIRHAPSTSSLVALKSVRSVPSSVSSGTGSARGSSMQQETAPVAAPPAAIPGSPTKARDLIRFFETSGSAPTTPNPQRVGTPSRSTSPRKPSASPTRQVLGDPAQRAASPSRAARERLGSSGSSDVFGSQRNITGGAPASPEKEDPNSGSSGSHHREQRASFLSTGTTSSGDSPSRLVGTSEPSRGVPVQETIAEDVGSAAPGRPLTTVSRSAPPLGAQGSAGEGSTGRRGLFPFRGSVKTIVSAFSSRGTSPPKTVGYRRGREVLAGASEDEGEDRTPTEQTNIMYSQPQVAAGEGWAHEDDDASNGGGSVASAGSAGTQASFRRRSEQGDLPLTSRGALDLIGDPTSTPFRTGTLFYFNVHARNAYWQRAQTVLFPTAIALSWIPPRGGRENVVLDLRACREVHSVPNPEHASSAADVGAMAARAQGLGRIFPFQLIFEDGVERLAAESPRDRVQWVAAVWDALGVTQGTSGARGSQLMETSQQESESVEQGSFVPPPPRSAFTGTESVDHASSGHHQAIERIGGAWKSALSSERSERNMPATIEGTLASTAPPVPVKDTGTRRGTQAVMPTDPRYRSAVEQRTPALVRLASDTRPRSVPPSIEEAQLEGTEMPGGGTRRSFESWVPSDTDSMGMGPGDAVVTHVMYDWANPESDAPPRRRMPVASADVQMPMPTITQTAATPSSSGEPLSRGQTSMTMPAPSTFSSPPGMPVARVPTAHSSQSEMPVARLPSDAQARPTSVRMPMPFASAASAQSLSVPSQVRSFQSQSGPTTPGVEDYASAISQSSQVDEFGPRPPPSDVLSVDEGPDDIRPSDSASQRAPRSELSVTGRRRQPSVEPTQMGNLRSTSVYDAPHAESAVRTEAQDQSRTPAQLLRDNFLSVAGVPVAQLSTVAEETRSQVPGSRTGPLRSPLGDGSQRINMRDTTRPTQDVATAITPKQSGESVSGQALSQAPSSIQEDVTRLLSYLEQQQQARAEREAQQQEEIRAYQEVIAGLQAREVTKRRRRRRRSSSLSDTHDNSREGETVTSSRDSELAAVQAKLDQVLQLMGAAGDNRTTVRARDQGPGSSDSTLSAVTARSFNTQEELARIETTLRLLLHRSHPSADSPTVLGNIGVRKQASGTSASRRTRRMSAPSSSSEYSSAQSTLQDGSWATAPSQDRGIPVGVGASASTSMLSSADTDRIPARSWVSAQGAPDPPPPTELGGFESDESTLLSSNARAEYLLRNVARGFPPPRPAFGQANQSTGTLDMEAEIRKRRTQQTQADGLAPLYPENQRGGWYTPRVDANAQTQRDAGMGTDALGLMHDKGLPPTPVHANVRFADQKHPGHPLSPTPTADSAMAALWDVKDSDRTHADQGIHTDPERDGSVRSTASTELGTVLAALRENERAREAQVKQQADIARYLNELNTWLERDVADRSKDWRAMARDVTVLHDELDNLRGVHRTPGPYGTGPYSQYHSGPPHPDGMTTMGDASHAPGTQAAPTVAGTQAVPIIVPGPAPAAAAVPAATTMGDPKMWTTNMERNSHKPKGGRSWDTGNIANDGRSNSKSGFGDKMKKAAGVVGGAGLAMAAVHEWNEHKKRQRERGLPEEGPHSADSNGEFKAKDALHSDHEKFLKHAVDTGDEHKVREGIKAAAAAGMGGAAVKKIVEHIETKDSKQAPAAASNSSNVPTVPAVPPPAPAAAAPAAAAEPKGPKSSIRELVAAAGGPAATSEKDGGSKSSKGGKDEHSSTGKHVLEAAAGVAGGGAVALAVEEILKHLMERKEEEKKREEKIKAEEKEKENKKKSKDDERQQLVDAIVKKLQEDKAAKDKEQAAKEKELDPKSAIESLVKAINAQKEAELKQQKEADKVVQNLANSMLASTKEQHKQTVDAVKVTAKEIVDVNVKDAAAKLNAELSKSVRTMLEDVGRIREAKRTLEMEMADLFTVKARHGSDFVLAMKAPPAPAPAPAPAKEAPKEAPKADGKDKEKKAPDAAADPKIALPKRDYVLPISSTFGPRPPPNKEEKKEEKKVHKL